jgi:hypothetical protein
MRWICSLVSQEGLCNMQMFNCFLCGQQPHTNLGRVIADVLRLRTNKHTTQKTQTRKAGLLWTSDQPVAQAAYPHHTQQTQEKNIPALSGIRNRCPNNQETADLHNRKHGQVNRPFNYLMAIMLIIIIIIIITLVRAVSQATSRCCLTSEARVWSQQIYVGLVVETLALGQISLLF